MLSIQHHKYNPNNHSDPMEESTAVATAFFLYRLRLWLITKCDIVRILLIKDLK